MVNINLLLLLLFVDACEFSRNLQDDYNDFQTSKSSEYCYTNVSDYL